MYEKIEKYLLEKGKVTIPEVQKEFSLDYFSARTIFTKLVENKTATLVDGLYYQVSSAKDGRGKRGKSPMTAFKEKLQEVHEEKKKSEEEKSSKKDDEYKWFAEFYDEEEEGESEDSTEETKKDEETKDTHDEEKGEEEVEEDEEDEEDENDDDGDKKSSFFGTDNDEFVRRNAIAKTVTCFLRNARFNGERDAYSCDLGATYPDDSKIIFNLYYDDGVWLSDGGRTLEYVSKSHDVKNDIFLKRVRSILYVHNQSLSDKDGKTEIRVKVEQEDKVFNYLLWLFASVSRVITL